MHLKVLAVPTAEIDKFPLIVCPPFVLISSVTFPYPFPIYRLPLEATAGSPYFKFVGFCGEADELAPPPIYAAVLP